MSVILNAADPLGNPNMRIMEVTPELAVDWLKRNTGNRPLKAKKIEGYASTIRGGGWKLTGEAIKFSSTGKLIDGQNRLHAVIAAKKPIQCVVMTDLGDDIFDVIDTGSPRSKADSVFLKFQLPTAKAGLLSSAASLAFQYANGRPSFKTSVSNAEVINYIENSPDLLDAVNYVYDNTPHENPIAKSVAAAFFFFAHRLDRELAEQFIARFMVGAVNGANDNLLYLRNICFNARAARRPLHASDIFGRLVIVWNSERRGKPIKHPTNIRLRSEESYPKFI